MNMETWRRMLKRLVFGRARDLTDQHLFHKLSLVALLAWVGLGADGLSSACYGPEETFKALGHHTALAVFVALGCILTIAIICASYRQIIELFPSGGGGYLVASKLLSPSAGVVSGSALLVDYVMTITISIASGADALFSILPPAFHPWKLGFACAGVLCLTVLNLRGVKESVQLWVPVFILFVGTHAIAIISAIVGHAGNLPAIASGACADIGVTRAELGIWGAIALILKAYSMGAGTYTGIEAVSNGLLILREPRVATGKRTMTYMGVSLAVTVFGLLLAYLLYDVTPVEGKTLNAVLFERITGTWPTRLAHGFVWASMTSAAVLLFIAAQAGFLDGPRVLASMALDRWFPSRFAAISDRFVTRNGILLMGAGAMLAMMITKGAVGLLVVLYSINVFVTFSLSQLGMVLHWWKSRRSGAPWKVRLAINGVGLCLTSFILCSLCIVKFRDGGWATLAVTGAVIGIAFAIKRHYASSVSDLKRLDELVSVSEGPVADVIDPGLGRTAIVLVNGFNGLGLHTFWGIARLFPKTYGHFIFVQVGVVDAGSFKGIEELARLREETVLGADRYVRMARNHGCQAEAVTSVSHDMVQAVRDICASLLEKHPGAVIFAGQLAFARETFWTRLLHNYAAFELQRFFCRQGVPFVIVPARVGAGR